MTRRTRRLLLFGLPAGLVAAMLAVWLLWPRTAITRENAERIAVGMTLAEVEQILGGPARDEATGPVTADGPGTLWLMAPRKQYLLVDYGARVTVPGAKAPAPAAPRWVSDQVMITVSLDADGRVESCNTIPVRRTEEGPLDRLRRWLGL
jgi:hypothetical protein